MAAFCFIFDYMDKYINSRGRFFSQLSEADKIKYGSVLADINGSSKHSDSDTKGEDDKPVELPASDDNEPTNGE